MKWIYFEATQGGLGRGGGGGGGAGGRVPGQEPDPSHPPHSPQAHSYTFARPIFDSRISPADMRPPSRIWDRFIMQGEECELCQWPGRPRDQARHRQQSQQSRPAPPATKSSPPAPASRSTSTRHNFTPSPQMLSLGALAAARAASRPGVRGLRGRLQHHLRPRQPQGQEAPAPRRRPPPLLRRHSHDSRKLRHDRGLVQAFAAGAARRASRPLRTCASTCPPGMARRLASTTRSLPPLRSSKWAFICSCLLLGQRGRRGKLQAWFEDVERTTESKFRKRTGAKRRGAANRVHYFVCHRSGVPKLIPRSLPTNAPELLQFPPLPMPGSRKRRTGRTGSRRRSASLAPPS